MQAKRVMLPNDVFIRYDDITCFHTSTGLNTILRGSLYDVCNESCTYYHMIFRMPYYTGCSACMPFCIFIELFQLEFAFKKKKKKIENVTGW